MAIFKAVQKKVGLIQKVVKTIQLIIQCIVKVLKAARSLLKSIRNLLRTATAVLGRLSRVIGSISRALAAAGKFAGPFKIIIRLIRVLLTSLRKGLRSLQKVIGRLDRTLKRVQNLFRINGTAARIKSRLEKILKSLQDILKSVNAIAKLLEMQQKFLEKILPPAFIKLIRDLLDAIDKPLKQVQDIADKIKKALDNFLKTIKGVQKQVDDVNKNLKTLDQFLKDISRAVGIFNSVVNEVLRRIQQIPFIGGLIRRALQFLGDVIDAIIDATGIQDLLNDLVKQSGIMDILGDLFERLNSAFLDLFRDFQAILRDIKILIDQLKDLIKKLKNLDDILRRIAVIKWLFEFRIPFWLRRMENGLQLLRDSSLERELPDDNRDVQIRLTEISVKGKGIGSDWQFQIQMGELSTTLEQNIPAGKSREVDELVFDGFMPIDQAVLNIGGSFSAVERDPVFDDSGSNPIQLQIENQLGTSVQTIDVTVVAEGGDKPATARIQAKLEVNITERQRVNIGSDELANQVPGLAELENAIDSLQFDFFSRMTPPALLAQKSWLFEFVRLSNEHIGQIRSALFQAFENREEAFGENTHVKAAIDALANYIQEVRNDITVDNPETDFAPDYYRSLIDLAEAPEVDLDFSPDDEDEDENFPSFDFVEPALNAFDEIELENGFEEEVALTDIQISTLEDLNAEDLLNNLDNPDLLQ